MRDLHRVLLPTKLVTSVYWFAWLSLLLCSPATSLEDIGTIPASLDQTFKQWMSENRVDDASLAAMKEGSIAKSFGYGRLQPSQPAQVASLSKAVTAVCIARLIDDGRLSFESPLGTVLAATFQRLGQPIDSRLKAITIEQLLKHRSGLPREPAGITAPLHNMSETFSKVLRTRLETEPGTKMSYSNIGYVTLGIVVEAISGRNYESYCRSAALEPMKATGSIDPQLHWRAPNGGWRISAIDYAKFVQAFDSQSHVLGSRSRDWLDAQTGNPDYGLGTFLRRVSNGINYWHDGSVATPLGGGAIFVKHSNGWTVIVIWVRRVEQAAYNDLFKRVYSQLQAQ